MLAPCERLGDPAREVRYWRIAAVDRTSASGRLPLSRTLRRTSGKGATDHDNFLYGLPVPALVEQLFESVGLRAKLSSGGLIARQLISQLGGLQGARVFKIPGVRCLLKTYGPRDAFTKKAALQLIGNKDPDNPRPRSRITSTFISSRAKSAPNSRWQWSLPISSRRACFASARN